MIPARSAKITQVCLTMMTNMTHPGSRSRSASIGPGNHVPDVHQRPAPVAVRELPARLECSQPDRRLDAVQARWNGAHRFAGRRVIHLTGQLVAESRLEQAPAEALAGRAFGQSFERGAGGLPIPGHHVELDVARS